MRVPRRFAVAIAVLVPIASIVTAGVPAQAAPNNTVSATAVAAGGHHACAILTGKATVRCWGLNNYGQLGDATLSNRTTPVTVYGLQNVRAIDAGWFHTCAINKANGVECWGKGSEGQLGQGRTFDQWVPVDVVGLASGVAQIAAGSSHTCALTTLGGVKCWGLNQHGQLGIGSLTNATAPVDVPGLSSGVAAVTAGADHSCALLAGGAVKCWGGNASGQLGDGTFTDALAPVDAVGLPGPATAVSAGYGHTCALVDDGSAWCWGMGSFGALGDGSMTDSALPVRVAGLSGVTWVVAGGSTSCAIAQGGAFCWGGNSEGQLGNGTTTASSVPVGVSGLASGVSAVAPALAHHVCGLLTTGGVRCWGYGGYGQMGNGTTTSVNPLPVAVSGFVK